MNRSRSEPWTTRHDIWEKEILKRDIQHFQKAVTVADQSSYTTRVGCVAAINARYLCGTFNKFRNHPKNVPHLEASRHAEVACLSMIETADLGKITLYVARINKVGLTLPSRPCIVCMNMIVSLGVREVVYVDKTSRVVKEYW